MRRVALAPAGVTELTFRLSKDHLALLHRMRTMRVTIRVQTDDGLRTRRIDLHAPARKRARGRASAPGRATA
jgi:hypothetical protein